MFSQDRVIRKRRTIRLLNRVWIIKPDRIFSRVKIVKCTSPDVCSCGEVKLRAEGVFALPPPPKPTTQKAWRCLVTDDRFDITVLGRFVFSVMFRRVRVMRSQVCAVVRSLKKAGNPGDRTGTRVVPRRETQLSTQIQITVRGSSSTRVLRGH